MQCDLPYWKVEFNSKEAEVEYSAIYLFKCDNLPVHVLYTVITSGLTFTSSANICWGR